MLHVKLLRLARLSVLDVLKWVFAVGVEKNSSMRYGALIPLKLAFLS